ncbi:MAG TPA: PmoA family protein [Gemmataceae bacterium]|nr:PmoA family protein [Gemmataceae bacterium]
MRMKRRLFVFSALLGLPLGWLAWPTEAQPKEETPVPAAPVSIVSKKGSIEFLAGKTPAAIYEKGGDLAKPYFWPLNTANNKHVTRDWPMLKAPPRGTTDHPHQKSAWFTHGDVIPEGMELKRKVRGVEGVDFWSEAPNHGWIVCTGASDNHNEANQGSVTTTNEWRTANGDKIMDEVRKIQFFNYPTARLFVVDIDLHASVVPITFGDTKEGAFGVRVADSIAEKNGKGHITNAEGKVGEKECWGRVSAWCDYSGPVEGDTVGIAIFAGPNNPIPSCWHSRAYGLMAANPFGRAKSGFPAMKGKKNEKDLVHLAKGEHLKLRYAMFIHLGDAKQGKVAENYELFKKMK